MVKPQALINASGEALLPGTQSTLEPPADAEPAAHSARPRPVRTALSEIRHNGEGWKGWGMPDMAAAPKRRYSRCRGQPGIGSFLCPGTDSPNDPDMRPTILCRKPH